MKPLSWALAEPRDTEYRPLSVVFQVLFRMAICIKTVLVANLYIWSNTPTLLMRRHKCLFEEKRLDWKKWLVQESLAPYIDGFQPMDVSHLALRLVWTLVLLRFKNGSRLCYFSIMYGSWTDLWAFEPFLIQNLIWQQRVIHLNLVWAKHFSIWNLDEQLLVYLFDVDRKYFCRCEETQDLLPL